MRGSVKNQIKQLWHLCDGIGISKYDTRKDSAYLGQNCYKVSDLVHSYQSKDEFILRAAELARFVKKEFFVHDMQAITNKHIQSYISWKIESDVSYRSISTYISQLEKIQVGLSKMEKKIESHNNLFDRSGLLLARETARKQAFRNPHKNRAYNNLNAIRSYLVSNEAKIAFELQKEHGLRVSEATTIREKQMLKHNTIIVQGKGGYKLNKYLTKDLYDSIKKYIDKNGSFKISYVRYTKELKSAVEKSNQVWHSSHGIRYNYAQRTYKEFIDKGLTNAQALQEVSYLMGHNRSEITSVYSY